MSKDNLENYKPIPNYSRYLISESGDVYDTETQRILVPNINGGYKCLNLFREDGKKVLEKVHRCVAYTYLVKPENSTNKLLHKTEDRLNNHVSNLEWKVKGVTHPMYKRFSNYHGVKYHLTELEEICRKSNLPLWTVRSRLENGYTVEEIYQGYKNSDVHWCDGIKFIGELELRRYNEQKAKAEKERIHQERLERIENERLKELERQRIILEKRGTDDVDLIREARSTWKGMMCRCYDKNRPDYVRYGAKGVTVCAEWQDQDVYCGWYIRNKIKGWDLEKDILQIGVPTANKVYGAETCCFVPRYLNQWFAKTTLPTIYQNSVGKSIKLSTYTGVFRVRKSLYGETENDLMEQWFLYKDLHMSRRFYDLKRDYNILKQSNPNLPEIHPALISVLENFSTEEYLRLRNI